MLNEAAPSEAQKKTVDALLLIVLIGLVAWSSIGVYLFYSKNGDIGNIYRIQTEEGGLATENLYDTIREWYDNPDDIVERLHQLTIYHMHVVRWPYYILVSSIISIMLLLIIGSFTWLNLVVAGIMICFGFFMSDHWYGTHVYGAHETEAAFLHNLYREMTKED